MNTGWRSIAQHVIEVEILNLPFPLQLSQPLAFGLNHVHVLELRNLKKFILHAEFIRI